MTDNRDHRTVLIDVYRESMERVPQGLQRSVCLNLRNSNLKQIGAISTLAGIIWVRKYTIYLMKGTVDEG